MSDPVSAAEPPRDGTSEAEAEPAATGSAATRLVILRGNSGSGKSTVAAMVRRAHGRGCALIEQDYLRRVLLWEHDTPDGHTAALIAQTVRFALDAGLHVICEGILHSARYGPMLTELCRAHRGHTAVFYLDVSLPETLRRHAGRPKATEFTAADMHRWYVPRDLLGVPGEQVVAETTSLAQTVAQVAAHLRPQQPPRS